MKLAQIAALPLALIAIAAARAEGNGTAGCSNSNCVDAPGLTTSDLSCDSDEDCAVGWTGPICACVCNRQTAAANTAGYKRLASAIPPCRESQPPCPQVANPRCFAHQCAVCGIGVPLPNQPAECDEDAGMGDARDEAAPDVLMGADANQGGPLDGGTDAEGDQ